MPRKPRLHYPGAVYHVILRGNDGSDIFFDKGDRTRFFLLCQQSCERYGCRIHAYCLMTNHLHLALQVGTIPLAGIMQNISFRYTQFINRKYRRTGHLFQGRYKGLLIDADRYLLELIRYIHLNPVRAGLVKHPAEYTWSSHCDYGSEARTPWLSIDWVLAQFGNNSASAVAEFMNFVDKGMDEGYRREFHSGSFEGRVLGDDSFINESMRRAEAQEIPVFSLDDVIAAVCCVYQLTETELLDPGKAQPAAEARAAAALVVRNTGRLTLTELGRRLNRDLTSLSQAARRLEAHVIAGKMPAEKNRMIMEKISDCQAT